MSPHAPRCPHCPGGPEGIRLVFGLPAGETIEAAQRGELVLGGCVLDPGPIPAWACSVCGANLGGESPGLGSSLPEARRPSPDVVRIATWNLERCPTSGYEKGAEIARWQERMSADIWLLTEVHRDWSSPAGSTWVSPPRGGDDPGTKRWAGIQTFLPMDPIDDGIGGPPAAEESLALARVHLPDGAPVRTVLVAASVLPWGGAGKYWRGLPEKYLDAQQDFVLQHHADRISAARDGEEPIVWGGDFNQELTDLAPERKTAGYRLAGTVAGIARLRAAFERLDLMPLTEHSAHRIPDAPSIDHLAVSRALVAEPATVHRPCRVDGTLLSDHAAYLADVVLTSGRAPA